MCYPIAALFGDGSSLVKGESGGPESFRSSWGPKPKPNQPNTPCNNKNQNIAIHMNHPIATLFGDGTSPFKGESGGQELYRNSWDPSPNKIKAMHTMQQQTKPNTETHLQIYKYAKPKDMWVHA